MPLSHKCNFIALLPPEGHGQQSKWQSERIFTFEMYYALDQPAFVHTIAVGFGNNDMV